MTESGADILNSSAVALAFQVQKPLRFLPLLVLRAGFAVDSANNHVSFDGDPVLKGVVFCWWSPAHIPTLNPNKGGR